MWVPTNLRENEVSFLELNFLLFRRHDLGAKIITKEIRVFDFRIEMFTFCRANFRGQLA